MTEKEKDEKRTSHRRIVKTEVAFNTENDIYIASTVDISEAGIRLITENPIDIRFQIKEGDEIVQYDAQLIWAKVKDDGSMEYGLKY